jgi:hypothetical protein
LNHVDWVFNLKQDRFRALSRTSRAITACSYRGGFAHVGHGGDAWSTVTPQARPTRRSECDAECLAVPSLPAIRDLSARVILVHHEKWTLQRNQIHLIPAVGRDVLYCTPTRVGGSMRPACRWPSSAALAELDNRQSGLQADLSRSNDRVTAERRIPGASPAGRS